VEKIDNSDFTLEFLSFGVDYPINDRPYSCYGCYTNAFAAAVFRITSPEINRRFPKISIAIFCDPSFFMKQLEFTKTLENGRLPIKYYYKGGGLYLDKLRVVFDDVDNIKGNQHILSYSKKRSEDAFVPRKKLVPGKLYSSTRTNYGTYFLYLGEFDKCLTITRWRDNILFDWNNPAKINYIPQRSTDFEHAGSLILEFTSFNSVDFDLKGLDYMSAIKTMITYHNNISASNYWGGLNIKVVPQNTLLRGIELDDFVKTGSLSPQEEIINYVDENIAAGQLDFLGHNLISSLIWDKVKNDAKLLDSVVTRFAIGYIHHQTCGKYEDIRDNFQTVTGISSSILDDKIKEIEAKIRN
jgi:hypothetical protein